ncbi:ABC transporter substrate-binding protein [Nocardioides sp. GY 10113]|uniref:ABC transporter substrate-binding protein n=1 Tax=Nocardioides sp. GY 10113 TaxID=2569761 RepID=UPI0019820974|nr:ABC transporter substrate-binding protein [Nocardioides sp. GY 10113]
MKRLLAVGAVLTSLSLATAACGGGEVRGAGGTGAAADDTFVYAFNLNVVTEWDPAESYSNEIIAMENLYESLTGYDSTSEEVTPRLATEWSSSEDGLTWTFTLRDGVTFHSGRALDATAAKQSIERTIELGGGPAYIWDAVKKIEATDERTLVFHLDYATPLDLVASSAYAAYIYDVEAAGDRDLAEWLDEGNDAGSGPYTVASWEPGAETELRLEAYDDYWGGWEDDQYRAVEFRVTPEVTTAWQLLQSGDIDYVERLSPQLFAQAADTDGVQTSEQSSFQNLLALFNTADGPLADEQVRKALRLLIDVPGLVAALDGAVVAADGVVPAGLLGAGEGYVLEQDVEAARSLLAEAGYDEANPLELTMTYAQGDDDQQLFATLLGSALAEVGGSLEAKPMQWNAQWKQATKGERQDIFVMYWYPDYADAYSWFANIFRSSDEPYFNLTYLEDAEVDQQIDALPVLTATDPESAAATYGKLQDELVTGQAAVAPLFVQTYQRAYADSVEGYVDNPAYPNVVFVHELTNAG